MTDVFIIHGTGGSPEDNWFPWLKNELLKSGCRVFVPKFPTPEGQSLQNWREVFRMYRRLLGEDSVVVGHSLGVAFLLDIIESLEKPIRAAFLVAGFTNPLDNPDFDPLNKTFVERKFKRREELSMAAGKCQKGMGEIKCWQKNCRKKLRIRRSKSRKG